jgi:prepilin-type processing-associated H-X9-DG protein
MGFFDQTVLYNAANFTIFSHCCNGCGDNNSCVANTTVTTTRIASFLCPSSPLPATTYWGKAAPGNCYFASVGSSLNWVGGAGSGAPNGIFMYGGTSIQNGVTVSWDAATVRGVRDVQDGTSNTIAFGEWRIGDFNCCVLTIPQDVVSPVPYPGCTWGVTANMPAGSATFIRWLGLCAGYAPQSIKKQPTWEYNMSYLGQDWNQGMFGWSLGNTLLAPNPQYPNCRTCTWNGDWDCPGMYGLSSYHPGGGNVAFADGSVRFLKSSTSMQAVWALGSRAQGEVVSSDQY